MKVKRFYASDNYEAMAQVRTELGPDAIILHQRKVKAKGVLGFLKKPSIEVVAAIEEFASRKNVPTNSKKALNTFSRNSLKVEKNVNVVSTNKKNSNSEVSHQIEELKNMLTVVVNKTKKDSLPDVIKDCDNLEVISLYNRLMEQGIDNELIEKMLFAFGTVNRENLSQEEEYTIFVDKLKGFLEDVVKVDSHKILPRIIFFVGPTGVGKTTTIAKLAAKYSLEEGQSVGLISADTYRIAAVEQLKTYSDILNIPLEIIYNSSEIDKAIERLSQNDIIIVDTAGRNHKNTKQITELDSLLNKINEKEVYLTLSTTSSKNDLKEIINAYSFIENYKVVLTKIDEATIYGSILNIATYTEKQLSYITTGQSVPDDIETVTIDKIIALLTEGGD
ncbi:MAG: flagellar biosynthesis protein FlhF [Alkaliphilus sp.]